mmetsp:Transcript_22647/g.51030  ORF Transcript_22647/g.51030 Transcript_22647/m.51030 type:complete len:160 (+) Transcript_22647:130-609(+)
MNSAGLEDRRRKVWERVVSLKQRTLPSSQCQPFPKGTSELQRKALNSLLAESLPALSDEVARDQRLQVDILEVLAEVLDGKLTSQAFYKCLERECKTKMEKFDAKAWRTGIFSLLDEFCQRESFGFAEMRLPADSEHGADASTKLSDPAKHRDQSSHFR